MQVRWGRVAAGIAVSALFVAGATECAADRSDRVLVDSPTYVPMSLPGGFGQHPLHYVERDDGYLLTARAHDTTYRVEVHTRADGATALDSARLASRFRRTRVRADGSMRWHDQVADVAITATGPPGHTARGVDWIARRMAIVPKRALDQLVAASRSGRRRAVTVDPIEFPGAKILVHHAMYGKLGRTSFGVKTGPVTNGQSACMGCEIPENVWTWREGLVLYTFVLAPPGTVVVPADGVQVERRYDPINSSDAILLRTERSDHPHFVIGTPHHRLHRWTMQESIL